MVVTMNFTTAHTSSNTPRRTMAKYPAAKGITASWHTASTAAW